MKILVAVDGSAHSLTSARFVTEHANWYREKPVIELVFVYAPLPHLPRMGLVVSEEQIQKYYREEGSKALSGTKQILDASGLTYNEHILVGPTAESIVQHANKSACDLVVVGSRGMGTAVDRVLALIGCPDVKALGEQFLVRRA